MSFLLMYLLQLFYVSKIQLLLGLRLLKFIITAELLACNLKHATHTVVFSQLNINGKIEGVHAFIVQVFN